MTTKTNDMRLGSTPNVFKWKPVLGPNRGPMVLITNEAGFLSTYFDPVRFLGYNALEGGVEEVSNEGLMGNQTEGHFYSSPTQLATTITLGAGFDTVGASVSVTAGSSVFVAADVTTDKSLGEMNGPGFGLITAQAGTTATITVRRPFSSNSFVSNGTVKGVLLMESFILASQGGVTQSRPFSTVYNKGTRKVESTDLSAGTGKVINFRFENNTGGSSSPELELRENSFNWRAPSTSPAANKVWSTDSYAGFGTVFNFFADGDSAGATGDGAGQIVYTFAGTSRFLNIVCGASQIMTFATTAAGQPGRVGINNFPTFGRFVIDNSVNLLTDPAIVIFGSTARTRGEIEVTHDGYATVGWRLRARGYVEVQGAGAIVGPSTGAQAVTAPTFTNKPGATTPIGNPAAWIPHLTTAGVVVWSPAWAD